MKTILLMLVACMLFIGSLSAIEVNTNTGISMSNVVNEINDSKLIINEWKTEVAKIKSDGFSLGSLLSIILLVFTSLTVLGVILVILINLIQFFTNDKIDIKLQKIEDWITKYIIKLPIKIITTLRGIVKKKP